ncbi:hypothetical protein FD755_018792, partial [Muntiacus reevesi]
DQEFLHAHRWDLPAGWGPLPSKDRSLLSCCYTWGSLTLDTLLPPPPHPRPPAPAPHWLIFLCHILLWLKDSLLTEKQTNKTNTTGCAIAAQEQAIRDAQECDDGEIQLYNEQIDTLRKETEEAERNLERSSYDCRQLVVAQQSLRNELDRYHCIIENTGNSSGGVYLVWGAGGPRVCLEAIPNPSEEDLNRDVQDITAVKPRLKGIPKNLPRKKDMVAKDRADEILEDTPLRGPEDTKPGRWCSKKRASLSLNWGMKKQDVPDGGKISKDFEKLGKMIKEKVKGPKEPEPPADLYTKRQYMTVSGDASLVGPVFCVFSIPAKGACGVEPSPQQLEHPLEDGQGPLKGKEHGCSPTPYPADKGDEENAKELKGFQGKQDGQKEEEGDRRPCPMVAPGPEALSTPRSQGSQFSLDGSKGNGAQSGSRPVMESIEKFSTGSIQMYEEIVVIVETTIEKTRQTRGNWERRDPPVPELTRRRCLWAPADMCFNVLEQRLQG